MVPPLRCSTLLAVLIALTSRVAAQNNGIQIPGPALAPGVYHIKLQERPNCANSAVNGYLSAVAGSNALTLVPNATSELQQWAVRDGQTFDVTSRPINLVNVGKSRARQQSFLAAHDPACRGDGYAGRSASLSFAAPETDQMFFIAPQTLASEPNKWCIMKNIWSKKCRYRFLGFDRTLCDRAPLLVRNSTLAETLFEFFPLSPSTPTVQGYTLAGTTLSVYVHLSFGQAPITFRLLGRAAGGPSLSTLGSGGVVPEDDQLHVFDFTVDPARVVGRQYEFLALASNSYGLSLWSPKSTFRIEPDS